MKTKRLIVNALGEYFAEDGDEWVDLLGWGMSAGTGANKFLTPEQQAIYRELEGPAFEALYRYLNDRMCSYELEAIFRTAPLPLADFYHRVASLQILNEGRFRVWGEKFGEEFDSPEHVWLVTEFQEFVDNTEFWDAVYLAAAVGKYDLNVLHQSPHIDKSWKPGVNGYESGGGTTDDNAVYGENHGRMERQIEFRQDLAAVSKERYAVHELMEAIIKMRAATEHLWEKAGVGVL